MVRRAHVVQASWLRLAMAMAGLAGLVAAGTPASAKPASDVIVLPGASSAEGITTGRGSTFYAGDFLLGDIFRGDLQSGAAELFIDAPDGRMALGMSFDEETGLLFVAGGFTGQAYVYDTVTGATVASYQLGDPSTTIVNDVTLTEQGAWFTNSASPVLYLVPMTGGVPGTASSLALSGPAAVISGNINLNGIAATADGATLVVAHSANAALYTVNPDTGTSKLIEGVSVPNVDGIVLQGRRLWAVQNFINQISAIRLSSDLSSGLVKKVITSSHFQTPTTAALHGANLAAVNAKFDTGIPPTADEYEVVIVRR
jgi:outer membrane protein assembly factor BamB